MNYKVFWQNTTVDSRVDKIRFEIENWNGSTVKTGIYLMK